MSSPFSGRSGRRHCSCQPSAAGAPATARAGAQRIMHDTMPHYRLAGRAPPRDRPPRRRQVVARRCWRGSRPRRVQRSLDHRCPTRRARPARAATAGAGAGRGLPLVGVPFAVKDNIDVAGLPTTAACPAFAYHPARSAPVVERLIAAGAMPSARPTWTSSPPASSARARPTAHRAACSTGVFRAGPAPARRCGRRRLVGFSLGTDTAGSGRVPAAFQQLVGLKPTRGVDSTRGVVPACRTLRTAVRSSPRPTGEAVKVFI